MILILFGPPGAGKGTQGTLLAERYDLRKISTGDLLRDAVRAQSQLGVEAKRFMDAGELVPDTVILGIVRDAISSATGVRGFLFDGFPRTNAQAEGVDALLADLGKAIDRVLVLDVADDTLVKRLSGRRSCPSCGSVYNVHYDPPKLEGICDRCGADLVQRSDDQADTVRRRLQVYRDQTAPLLEYYRTKGVGISNLDGDRPIEDVQAELKRELGL